MLLQDEFEIQGDIKVQGKYYGGYPVYYIDCVNGVRKETIDLILRKVPSFIESFEKKVNAIKQ